MIHGSDMLPTNEVEDASSQPNGELRQFKTITLLTDTISQKYHLALREHHESLETGDSAESDSSADVDSTALDGVEEQKSKNLDPLEWKHHDHYANLGLKTKRCRATDDDVRQACKHCSQSCFTNLLLTVQRSQAGVTVSS